MTEEPKILLLDANVLIDYRKSDFSVLGLVNNHVGEVRVLTTIIEEVDGLDVVDCKQLGLKVVEPELGQLTRAAAKRGQFSFRDHLCLLLASEAGLVCVTNDKRLRKACTEEGVAVLWGLEIMTALVRLKAMHGVDAIRIAEQIHLSNPLHITKPLIERFARRVAGIEKRHRRPD